MRYCLELYMAVIIMVARCNGSMSYTHTVKLSVPQGSVAVSLIFLLYVRRLPQWLDDVRIIFFADDTKIMISKHNVVRQVRSSGKPIFLLGIKEYFFQFLVTNFKSNAKMIAFSSLTNTEY